MHWVRGKAGLSHKFFSSCSLAYCTAFCIHKTYWCRYSRHVLLSACQQLDSSTAVLLAGTMRSRSWFTTVLGFGIWEASRVNATTVIEVFSDYDCQDSLGSVQTSLIAAQGDCAAVPKATRSVRPLTVDLPCNGGHACLIFTRHTLGLR